ncbi:TRAP transporter substrate-binding protein [Aquincola sp. S2]|uniref:TRAP transporter substrate-binding protein n=1 Tax=Pseudaquabacterium terrae TaxID=2732868 RepID=A0ABX2EPZ3_9BURK|nr:TRAP transporter substrate-binding protein [Aquabacterium terrae]NRF70663.1 TRAP transporter substrate-binding protein [Aquabacterium terrae]
MSEQLTSSRRDCLALALAAAGATWGIPARAADTWRLATGYRADSLHGQNLRQFADELAQLSAGALRIELHTEGKLLPLPQMLPGLMSGKAELGEAIMTGLVKDLPLAGADSVPFIVRSYDDARRLWRHQRPLIEANLASRGLRVLMAVPWPPQGLFSQRPINGATDLRGLNMRTYNSTTVRIAELLQAKAVDVPMIQVGQALAEGRINAMITSAVTGVENQVWSGLKFYYPINAWFPKNLLMVRKEAFDKLDAGQQRLLLQAAVSAEQRGWRLSEQAARESVETLRGNGMRIEPVTSELSQALRRLGEKLSLEWVRSVGPEANQMFISYFTQG